VTPQQERIVAAARSWIGTPFFPHMALKGVGADCVQLAHAIYQEAGVAPEGSELPAYRLGDGDCLDASLVTQWVERATWFDKAEQAEPGDLVTLRVARVSHHVGVVTGATTFVQALRRYGVREWRLDEPTWHTRIEQFWRPKHVDIR